MPAKSYERLSTLTSVTSLTSTVYRPKNRFPTSLYNGVLTSGTGWTGANDFSSSANTAVYTHSTGAGTYTQAVGSLARTGRSGAKYEFWYTVSSPSDDAPTIQITTDFAATATDLIGLDTAGIYMVSFTAASTPGDFKLSGTSTGAGAVTLDSLVLYEIVGSDIQREAHRAIVECQTAAINFTTDGTTPTVTTSSTYQGHTLNPGDILTLNDISEIEKFKCINAVASNGAAIKATYLF